MNDTPFALDQDANLLCPNSFVKTTSLSIEGPPLLKSSLPGINKMSKIIRDNYILARDLRIRQITNNIEGYKEKRHLRGNRMKIVIKPTLGAPCFLHNPEKFDSIKYGKIEELNDFSATVKLRDGKSVTVPLSIIKVLELPVMKD